ncbi:hypothetical protein [Marinoscillum furvescens]|uniref:Thiamine pyrophosphokinase n=1 Tax=Marinoscillum furvescens DSM 4134 TaxID=1122208 RepID=A0A3D9L607_MARFU|nr:hypothetical protein [Marinoscillum furvescens]REE01610.1 hypothetical protein C7460_103126 [Marinoscillum furvescens DSM 4134]
MSSHHIVRDEQEPALILHQLAARDTGVLHHLLEWSPVVVCCQDSIDLYTSMNHKLDFALVGFPQMEKWKEYLADQQPVKLMAVHGEDFLQTGLMLLARDGHPAVNVITSEDALPEVIGALEQWAHKLNVVIYAGGKRHLFIHSKTYRKWLPVGSVLQLWSLGAEAQWQVRDAQAHVQEFSAAEKHLEIANEGEVEISCERVPFMVVEDL